MKTRDNLLLFTSPPTQLTRKPYGLASLTLRQRHLYGRPRRYNTGKELDSETGLYYYGARYLDPRVSRWLSGDPAMGEYVPSAPVNEEARKRNGNLPGMGGVFNTTNLHMYNYSINNPVKYNDPDGEVPFLVVTGTIGAVAGGAYGAYKSYSETGKVDLGSVGKGALIGGLTGLTLGAGIAAFATGSVTASSAAVMGGLGLGGSVTTGLTTAKGVETALKDGQMGQVLMKGNEVVAFSTKAVSHLELAKKAGLDPNSVVGATVLKMRNEVKAIPSQSVQGAAQNVLDLLPSIVQ